MSRASGYFLVLVAVWMPNLVYNILSIQYGVNSGYTVLEDVVDIITAAQVNLSLVNAFRPDFFSAVNIVKGFLNVLVYIGSHRHIRRWFLYNMASFRIFRILMGLAEPLLAPEMDRVLKNAVLLITSDRCRLGIMELFQWNPIRTGSRWRRKMTGTWMRKTALTLSWELLPLIPLQSRDTIAGNSLSLAYSCYINDE